MAGVLNARAHSLSLSGTRDGREPAGKDLRQRGNSWDNTLLEVQVVDSSSVEGRKLPWNTADKASVH